MSSPIPPSDPGAPSLAAIFLGASKFEYFPRLDNPVFLASKIAFCSAFTDPSASIFGNRIAVLDLFDQPQNPIEVIREVKGFLSTNNSLSDVLLYYCGHGFFLEDNTYVLLLKNTVEDEEYTTGLQSSALKSAFERHRGNKRLFIIVDCCYAGEVTRTWMSRDGQPLIAKQRRGDFPRQGTVLALAASKDEVALAPEGDALTLFTGALVKTMRAGITEAPKYISFRDLFSGARDWIATRGDRVIPVLHQVGQEGGDVTQMPIFANAAYGRFTDPMLQTEIDGAMELLSHDSYAVRLAGLRRLDISLDRVAFELRQTVANQLEEMAKSDDSARVRALAEQVREYWLKSLSLQPGSPGPISDEFFAVPVSQRTDFAPVSEVGQPAFLSGAAVPAGADRAPGESSSDAPGGTSLATGLRQDDARAQSSHTRESYPAGFFHFIWPDGRAGRLVRIAFVLLIAAFGLGLGLAYDAHQSGVQKAADAKAAEDARRVADAKAADEARRVADAKAAEDARRVADAKAAEDARRVADAKAAEDARRVADAKAAEDARRVADAKAADEARRVADAKAAEDARRVADAKAADEARRVAVASPGLGKTFKDCPTCPEMVVVPAGQFTMGSPTDQTGHVAEESPQHKVTIGVPFAVGRFAVTFDEWDACGIDKGCNGYKPPDNGWGRGRRPVISVNWNDAKVYIAWLSNKTGQRYRLLSEAEREYVARAGSTTPFWFGASISPQQANYNGTITFGYEPPGENREKTVPVDSFAPNPWGLYQVSGNVNDWVEDCVHDNYNGAPSDGSPWTTGDCSSRVSRGGSWFSSPISLRSAHRGNSYTSDTRLTNLGFRVAGSIGLRDY